MTLLGLPGTSAGKLNANDKLQVSYDMFRESWHKYQETTEPPEVLKSDIFKRKLSSVHKLPCIKPLFV